MKLTGRWNVKGVNNSGGFLIGNCRNTAVSNINCLFDTGSQVEQDSTSSSSPNLGGVIGQCYGANVYGITLEGELSIIASPSASIPYIGGMCGAVNNNSSAQFLRNLATFSSTLDGGEVGGIIGRCFHSALVSMCLNAMTGNLQATRYAGGVIGFLNTSSSNHVQNHLVNSMRGDITAGNPTLCRAGGVIGGIEFETGHVYDTLLNYMTGDIVGIFGAGLIGRTLAGSSFTVPTSMVAMNGSVKYAATVDTFASVVVHADTSFGFTYDNGHSLTFDALSDLPIDGDSNLPYFDFVGTDSFGISYDWEFVFGNLPEGLLWSQNLSLLTRPFQPCPTLSPTN